MDNKIPGLDCASLGECYRAGGWFWSAAFAVSMALRWLQSAQGESVVSRIGGKFTWSRLPLPIRLGISVVVSCIASTLVGVHAGQAWWMALLGGIPTAIVAAGTDRQINTVVRSVTPSESASIKTKVPKVF